MNLEISVDKRRLDVELIHAELNRTYWAAGMPRATLEKAIAGSLCYGVYDGERQIAFARVISDFATFAYLSDVFVIEAYRGRGVSKRLVTEIQGHPGLQGLRRFCLATLDAHSLYEQFGFKVTQEPRNWMEIKDPDVYRR